MGLMGQQGPMTLLNELPEACQPCAEYRAIELDITLNDLRRANDDAMGRIRMLVNDLAVERYNVGLRADEAARLREGLREIGRYLGVEGEPFRSVEERLIPLLLTAAAKLHECLSILGHAVNAMAVDENWAGSVAKVDMRALAIEAMRQVLAVAPDHFHTPDHDQPTSRPTDPEPAHHVYRGRA